MDPREILRRTFGHDEFRPGQETVVNALLHHRDALGIMPTGAGKSVCYQVPALMLPGVSLVISPLISLMSDQVAALKSAGIPAAYFNSSLTPRQMELAMQRALQGAYKIIYVAPERLETTSFLCAAKQMNISLIAVDEAHCVSQWGQDFRPVYLRIAEFVDALPVRPAVGAFTATATEHVRDDIIRLLRLRQPELLTTGFDRPNLYFEVVRPKNRDAALLSIVRRKSNESGIVYCATRKAVEQVCGDLNRAGIAATRYHAGLGAEERKANQEKFQYDISPVMVATNAFGMGIDKSNVRYVVHYQMPRSMEAYYQEAGRAGRDGAPAECILLYNGSDIFTAKWMIEHSEPNENMTAEEQSAVRRQDLQRLNQMIDYCTKSGCLRTFILRYFGENASGACGHCSACSGNRYGEAEVRRKRCTASELPNTERKSGKIAAPNDGNLFEQLRQVRMALAKQRHVPPYVICNDTTLSAMVQRKPETLEGMRTVSGMGEVKTEKYGEAFLQVIRPYAVQERRMKADIKALAERAQSSVFRSTSVSPFSGQTKGNQIKRNQTKSENQAQSEAWTKSNQTKSEQAKPVDWDNLRDDEVLADAYLSGITVAEMARHSGLSQSYLRERLRDLDLIF